MSEESEEPFDLAVIGLGYVGLPIVAEACRAGMRVVGIDKSLSVVNLLNAGTSHVDDISNVDVKHMLDAGWVVTVESSVIARAEVVLICVPTPLGPDSTPDLHAVIDATKQVAEHLRPKQLVILESTTYPGTTEEIVQPVLEKNGMRAGIDFFLAYSPERIDPGNRCFQLRNTPKIVAGLTESCAVRAKSFYSQLVDNVIMTSGLREAEMTKLLENTYRHVNIALVNELAQFCQELDIDIWEVIRCADTKPFGFSAFLPGPGVGGHCIPIDPSFLSHNIQTKLGKTFRFVELAKEINASMPQYVVHRVQELLNEMKMPVHGSSLLLIGVTYKADVADQRESPAADIARLLKRLGAHVEYVDPHVEDWEIDGEGLRRWQRLEDGLQNSHMAVLLQQHSLLDVDLLESCSTPVFDTRGVLRGDNVRRM